MEKFYFAYQELSDKFNVSRTTLTSWVTKGMKSTKVGTRRYVDIADFMEYYFKYQSYHRQVQSEDDLHPRDLKDLYSAYLNRLDYFNKSKKVIEPDILLEQVREQMNHVRTQVLKNYITMTNDLINISDERTMVQYLKDKAYALVEILRADIDFEKQKQDIEEYQRVLNEFDAKERNQAETE